jgi:hypothetical protein
LSAASLRAAQPTRTPALPKTGIGVAPENKPASEHIWDSYPLNAGGDENIQHKLKDMGGTPLEKMEAMAKTNANTLTNISTPSPETNAYSYNIREPIFINPVIPENHTNGEQVNWLHLDKHKYAGPGTNVQQQETAGAIEYDYDDVLAHKHDIAYNDATNWDDISLADDQMIHGLDELPLNQFTSHNALIIAALKAKKLYNSLMKTLGGKMKGGF